MNKLHEQPNDTKKIFKKCGTCSKTFAYLLDREFGHQQPAEEQALDLLAGGIMNSGHQCGMLWGASLGTGAEAHHRYKDKKEAIAVSISAVQQVVDSFEERSKTVNCREITGVKLDSVSGMVKFMVRSFMTGMDNNQCFKLAEAWTPEAIRAAKTGLKNEPCELIHEPTSCASLVIEKMGGTEKEQVMVSGFAGGLGLSGQGCGALAAAIWMKTLQWCRENPGKRPPYFNNDPAKKIYKAFKEFTNDEMDCSKISGQSFDHIDDHSEFMHQGGCAELIELLSKTG